MAFGTHIFGQVPYGGAEDELQPSDVTITLSVGEGIIVPFESPDLAFTVVTRTLELTGSEALFSFAEDFRVYQTHPLVVGDIVVPFSNSGVNVSNTRTLEITSFAQAQFAFSDVSIALHHELLIDMPEANFSVTYPTISQTRVLQISDAIAKFSITPIWFGPPTGLCLVDPATRVPDAEIEFFTDPDASIQSFAWQGETRYRIALYWDGASYEQAMSIRGFFESYQMREFIYTWPADNKSYRCTVENEAKITPLEGGSWKVEAALVGYEY